MVRIKGNFCFYFLFLFILKLFKVVVNVFGVFNGCGLFILVVWVVSEIVFIVFDICFIIKFLFVLVEVILG